MTQKHECSRVSEVPITNFNLWMMSPGFVIQQWAGAENITQQKRPFNCTELAVSLSFCLFFFWGGGIFSPTPTGDKQLTSEIYQLLQQICVGWHKNQLFDATAPSTDTKLGRLATS